MRAGLFGRRCRAVVRETQSLALQKSREGEIEPCYQREQNHSHILPQKSHRKKRLACNICEQLFLGQDVPVTEPKICHKRASSLLPNTLYLHFPSFEPYPTKERISPAKGGKSLFSPKRVSLPPKRKNSPESAHFD